MTNSVNPDQLGLDQGRVYPGSAGQGLIIYISLYVNRRDADVEFHISL